MPILIIMQEVRELESKLRRASNEEERRVISQELEITHTKKVLADFGRVRQKFEEVIILLRLCLPYRRQY